MTQGTQETPKTINDFGEINIYKQNGFIPSKQKDRNAYQFFTDNCLAVPRVDKVAIAETLIKSASHVRAIEIVANSTVGLGYTFKDQKNAEDSGVVAFLNDGLRGRGRNHISFTEFCVQLVSARETFGSQMMEIAKIAQKPLKDKGLIYFANPKNFYISNKRTDRYYYEVLDNSYQINYGSKFGIYGVKTTSGSSDIYEQKDLSLLDDYYSIPTWYPTLKKIVLNELYDTFNTQFTSNSLSAALAVIIEEGQLDDGSKASLKEQLSTYSGSVYAGKTILLQGGMGGIKVRFEPITRQQDRQGGYREDIDANDLAIFMSHGVDSKLAGFVQKNGISSGMEQLSAIQVFENMKIKPLRKQQEEYWNYLFTEEFEGYNTQIEFNSLDMTDAKTDSEIRKNTAETYKLYKEMGATIEMFNLFHMSLKIPLMTDEEYDTLMTLSEEPDDVMEAVDEEEEIDNDKDLS